MMKIEQIPIYLIGCDRDEIMVRRIWVDNGFSSLMHLTLTISTYYVTVKKEVDFFILLLDA